MLGEGGASSDRDVEASVDPLTVRVDRSAMHAGSSASDSPLQSLSRPSLHMTNVFSGLVRAFGSRLQTEMTAPLEFVSNRVTTRPDVCSQSEIDA